MSTKTDLRLPASHKSLTIPKTREAWSDVCHILNAKSDATRRVLGRTVTSPRASESRPSFAASIERTGRGVDVQFNYWNTGAAAAWAALQLYRDMKGPEVGVPSLTLEDYNVDLLGRFARVSRRRPYLHKKFSVAESTTAVRPAVDVQVRTTGRYPSSIPELLQDVKGLYDELYEDYDHATNDYKVGRAVGAVSLRQFCEGWEGAYAQQALTACTPAEAARAFLYGGTFTVEPW